MKFGFVLKNQGIPEWKEMYLNYKILKKLVKPYKTMSKIYMKINYLEPFEATSHIVTNGNMQFFDELKHFGINFEEISLNECQKISNFFEFKLLEELKRWKLFKINISILQNIQNDKDYYLKKIQLLNAFHYFYKELNLLNEFISVNQEGLRKIIKKFKKNSKSLENRYKILKKKIRESNSKSFLKNAIQKLIFLRTEVESSYIDTFYKKYDRKDGQNTLRKISQGKLMTNQQSFFFGFFLGFVCLLLIVIFSLFWLLDLDIELLAAFPLFKGIGFLFVYYWTLAINVFFWMKYNINYKLIFQFNFHFSEISEIFKRVSVFSTIYLMMLLWFLILNFQSEKLGELFGIIPQNVTPFIVWIVFFGYCFFPSITLFNSMGRFYVLKLIIDVICSPFIRIGVTFRAFWALDQLMSFSWFFRDLHYLVMFLTSQNTRGFYYLFGYWMIMFLLGLKVIQGIRLLKDSFSWKSLQIFEIARNLCVFGLVFNEFNSDSNLIGVSWLIFAFVIAILFSCWDLIEDWKLVQKDSKYKFLRKELSFESHYIYYFFICGNFFLRLCWIFTLVPKTFGILIDQEYLLCVIELLEILRRGIWNFLIIEKQHIMNCGIFKAVEEIKLPYENIQFEMDQDQFLKKEFKFIDKKEEKFDSEMSSPLMSRKSIKLLIKTDKNAILKTEDLLGPGNFQAINEENDEILSPKELSLSNLKYNKEFYDKVKEDIKVFCSKVKFNMEFNFKVMNERNEEMGEGIKIINLSHQNN